MDIKDELCVGIAGMLLASCPPSLSGLGIVHAASLEPSPHHSHIYHSAVTAWTARCLVCLVTQGPLAGQHDVCVHCQTESCVVHRAFFVHK